MQNKPSEETNQDISIKIYVKEFSRLMESGMDYDDASKAADCIVQPDLTNDRDRSGRFDDWLARLESVLVLGNFEESRKIILLRSKLYDESADEFDHF
ncbi:hypothetical protein OUZ56_003755 [Daphnia magna]|uniref:Uncharacterized protein n=1 Tax=Daphnia magna TaxID=35525 RepID=A0ABR0A9P8_9CRUS|nr:hypothetical protein OUZ56_003755 [Daphnia magna]